MCFLPPQLKFFNPSLFINTYFFFIKSYKNKSPKTDRKYKIKKTIKLDSIKLIRKISKKLMYFVNQISLLKMLFVRG